MALNTVSLPFGYYPDPTQGRPVFNGSIFIGEPDTDPTILANQKTITIRQEGVDTPSVEQPIFTSAGGVPVFNGSPAEILVEGEYSLAVLNAAESQVYYVANGAPAETAADKQPNDKRYGPIFATVAAMTAANPVSIDGVVVNLVAGMTVHTQGFSVAGGEGASKYFIVAGDSSNGFDRLLLANGLTAVLQPVNNTLTVEQFGATGDNVTESATQLQAALDYSDANEVEIVFSNKYRIGTKLSIQPGVRTRIIRRSSIQPTVASGLADAYLFEAGNALGIIEMPILALFSGVAAEVKCNLANIYIPEFNTCGVCYKVTTNGTSVLDTRMRFNAISACDVAVEINMLQGTDVFQGCSLEGSFITNTTDVFVRTGVAAFDDGFYLSVLAIDFTDAHPGGALLDNRVVGHPVARVNINVPSWFGGEGFVNASPTQLYKGRFDNGRIDLVNATQFNLTHVDANDYRSGNILFRGKRDVGSPFTATDTAAIAGFNGGVAISNSEFLIKCVLPTDLLAGTTRPFYFYHIFADSNYPSWDGISISGDDLRLGILRVIDRAAIEDGRVELLVKNYATDTSPSGTVVTFKIKRS
jgi:hypothetical protein